MKEIVMKRKDVNFKELKPNKDKFKSTKAKISSAA